MPRVRSRQAAFLVALALLGGPVSGCSLLSSGDDPAGATSGAATSAVPAPPDVVAGLEKSLRRRAAAVRRVDADRFTRGLARGEEFRREQQTYFDNLRQLPLGVFRYTFDPAEVVRVDADYWVVVDVHLQLAGYDALPVVSRDRYRFTPASRPGRFRLASVTDPAWEAEHDVSVQPWDTGPIEVRSGAGVLGIFDADSVGSSGPLLRSVERGIADVSATVPYAWSRTVVLYALSDTDFLGAIRDLPGGDPEVLDGVSFPVLAGPGDDELASTRFVLHPRMLSRTGIGRDRLVRHELTHVAIGDRDDDAPVWLSEGVAEYVSVRPLPPEDRSLAHGAVAAAEAGFTDLPADEGFNDSDSAAHYGLAWWACEYLADSYGEITLWTLLDDLNRPGADTAQELETLVGLSPRQLARKAGRLLLATFETPASQAGVS